LMQKKKGYDDVTLCGINDSEWTSVYSHAINMARCPLNNAIATVCNTAGFWVADRVREAIQFEDYVMLSAVIVVQRNGPLHFL
jgi:hypothetical protein